MEIVSFVNEIVKPEFGIICIGLFENFDCKLLIHLLHTFTLSVRDKGHFSVYTCIRGPVGY
jgi:hypothetical protein